MLKYMEKGKLSRLIEVLIDETEAELLYEREKRKYGVDEGLNIKGLMKLRDILKKAKRQAVNVHW